MTEPTNFTMQVEEEKIVPSYALDLIVEQHKSERKKLWIALFVVFIALVGSNVGWLIYESQFEDIVTTVSQEAQSEGEGDAIINGDHAGVVYNGTSEANDNDKDTP